MATFTAVLVVPNELDQGYLQAQLERLGVLAFFGPGSLVSEDDLSDDQIMETQRSAVELEVGGCTVVLSAECDGDGVPFARVSGMGCRLEGEMPGEYYPVPLSS